MELQRLKGQTVDGYGLNVSTDEALEIIVSLVSQLHTSVAAGRAEWQAEGAGYFSIFVTNNEKPPLPDAHPLMIDRSIEEPPCPSELDDIRKELRICGKCVRFEEIASSQSHPSERGYCSKRMKSVWRIGFAGKCEYYKKPPLKTIVMSSEQMAHMDDIELGITPPPILCPIHNEKDYEDDLKRITEEQNAERTLTDPGMK